MPGREGGNRTISRAHITESMSGKEPGDLQRLSKDELIELVLRMQRTEKTSRTSSKSPATDRKERRDKARPGGDKHGHEARPAP
jgi:hypothetical protein